MGLRIATRIGSNVVVGDDSAFSIPATIQPANPPTIDSASAIDANTIEVAFSRATPFNFFDIEFYLDAGLTILFGEYPNSIGGDVTNYIFSNGTLDPATQYWIRVRVSSDGGSAYSSWSTTATATTP